MPKERSFIINGKNPFVLNNRSSCQQSDLIIKPIIAAKSISRWFHLHFGADLVFFTTGGKNCSQK